MKPQCPGTCSSWKGCCILVTSWHLGLLFPMSAANMSTTEPLPIHYSDWIRGKTVPGPIIDLICSAVLKVLPSASGFLLQTWQRIRIVPMHWVQILQGITSPPAWIKNIKATALFHKQGIMMTFFFTGCNQPAIKTLELTSLLYLCAKYSVILVFHQNRMVCLWHIFKCYFWIFSSQTVLLLQLHCCFI